MIPSDCLVGKTASLFCIAISEVQIQIVVNVLPELQTSWQLQGGWILEYIKK